MRIDCFWVVYSNLKSSFAIDSMASKKSSDTITICSFALLLVIVISRLFPVERTCHIYLRRRTTRYVMYQKKAESTYATSQTNSHIWFSISFPLFLCIFVLLTENGVLVKKKYIVFQSSSCCTISNIFGINKKSDITQKELLSNEIEWCKTCWSCHTWIGEYRWENHIKKRKRTEFNWNYWMNIKRNGPFWIFIAFFLYKCIIYYVY